MKKHGVFWMSLAGLSVFIAIFSLVTFRGVYGDFEHSSNQLKTGMAEAETLQVMSRFQAQVIATDADDFSGFPLPKHSAKKIFGFIRGNRITVIFYDQTGVVIAIHRDST